jgi:sugar phosphate isomerase/epimerase
VIVGAMNNPFAPVLDEIRWIGTAGFDFVDLTLEPPGAWPVEPLEIKALLEEQGLGVVGHTAFFLPIASPYPELRRAARTLFAAACDAFATIGAERVNVHPDPVTRSYPRDAVLAENAEAMVELAGVAEERGLRLMLENLGPAFGTVDQLRPLLEADPRVAFHLDVGHANLGGNRLRELLAAFGDRLAHVHVSDNLGVDDLHLPLGAGAVAWPDAVSALKELDYDGTVTIEVFSRPYLASSAQLWREWWDAPG